MWYSLQHTLAFFSSFPVRFEFTFFLIFVRDQYTRSLNKEKMATMLMQTEVQYQAPVMMVAAVSTPRKLWEHPDPKSTAMWKFIQDANAKRGLQMQVCFACGLGDTESGACLREASCASGMFFCLVKRPLPMASHGRPCASYLEYTNART